MYFKSPQVRLIECLPSNCDALSSAGIGTTHVAVFDDPHAWCLSACLALQRWAEADQLWMPFKNLILNLFLHATYGVAVLSTFGEGNWHGALSPKDQIHLKQSTGPSGILQ